MSAENEDPKYTNPPSAMLNWAEGHGLENLREHIADLDALKKDATQMVSLIIVGLGATIGYVAHQVDQGALGITGWAVAVLSLYLCVAAALLIVRALMIREKPLASDEPLGLVDARYTIQQMKLAEIRAIQGRIKTVAARNAETAKWINYARWMAVAAPLVFGAALGLAKLSGVKASAPESSAKPAVVKVVVQAQERVPAHSSKPTVDSSEDQSPLPIPGSAVESQVPAAEPGPAREPVQAKKRVLPARVPARQ